MLAFGSHDNKVKQKCINNMTVTRIMPQSDVLHVIDGIDIQIRVIYNVIV